MVEDNKKAIRVEKDMDIKLIFPEGTTKTVADEYKSKLAETLEKEGHAYIDESITVERVNVIKAEEVVIEDKDKSLSFEEVQKMIKESGDTIRSELETKLNESKIKTAEAEAKLAEEKEKADKEKLAAAEKAAEAATPPKDDPVVPPVTPVVTDPEVPPVIPKDE